MLAFQERGEVAAFEQLFRRHRQGLFRALLHLAGSDTVAEELSQQVWLSVLETAERGQYRAAASFRTFLFTLARNRYLDEQVRRHGVARSESLEELPEALEPQVSDEDEVVELLTRAGLAARVSEALGSLPEAQREVISLWIGGLQLVEVAEVTGASWHTVVARKRYALAKLRRALASLVPGGGH